MREIGTMSEIALIMVVAAAFLHAGWNYLAKKSYNKIVFIWWFLLISQVLYLPVLLFFWPLSSISVRGWGYIAATGLLHFFYYWFLGRAYGQGDLSLVYPLARGSGPLIVPILALVLIGESLSIQGGCGIVLVVIGIYVLHLQAFTFQSFYKSFQSFKGKSSLWALAAGVSIAFYSIVDKIGVSMVPPPLYLYLMISFTLVLLTAFILKTDRRLITREWRLNRTHIFIVALLDPGVYLLILFALQMSKVSYVVAVRQISIVFSVIYGVLKLREKHGQQKVVGAGLITLGVVLIGLAG